MKGRRRRKLGWVVTWWDCLDTRFRVSARRTRPAAVRMARDVSASKAVMRVHLSRVVKEFKP